MESPTTNPELDTRSLQEEKPSGIFSTTSGGHKITFLCYIEEDDVLTTDSKWKIKLIDNDVLGSVLIKYYIDKSYTHPIATTLIPDPLTYLTALYVAGTGFQFKKDI